MKNLSRILIMMTLVPVAIEPLIAQWVQTGSLCGGYITSFAVTGTKIYAGESGNGLFVSTNNGASWAKLGLNDGTWLTSLVIGPDGSGGDNLYVGATSGAVGELHGVIRSTNNGNTWIEVNDGLTNFNVTALAVVPRSQDSSIIFAATNGGGLFRSMNNGAHWTEADSGLGHPCVAALAVSGSNVFAGANYGGVWVTTDNGASWTGLNTGLTNTFVTALAVSTDGATLFAGTDGGGVFVSTNKGTTWAAANGGLGDLHIRSLIMSGTSIFAGTHGKGVYRSFDGGSNWTAVNSGLTFSNVTAFAIISNGGEASLFAGTWGGGVYRSTNDGTDWIAVDSGLICRCVNALAFCDSSLYAWTNGCGGFISNDNGSSWARINAGMDSPNVYALAVVPDGTGGMNMVAGAGGIFVSTDNGSSWIRINDNNRSFMGDVHAFAVSIYGTDSSRIYAGNNALDIHQVQVFLSSDNGFTWAQCGVNINASRINALAISGENLLAGTTDGVFLTTNNGASWTCANNGLTDSVVNAFTVLSDSGGGVIIFATTSRGLYVSHDNGGSWTWANSDVVSTQAHALIIFRKNMFAGTNQVWKRPLAGMKLDVDGTRDGVPQSFLLSQNYPNPFNPSTTLRYGLPARSHVRILIYNILGQVVADLLNTEQPAGWTAVVWKANVASGLYFYRLEAVSVSDPGRRFVDVKKMILLK